MHYELSAMSNMTILNEGRNCWRKVPAGQVAFLIDGAAYFEALVDAVRQAQNSIYIAAWDIDSRTKLLRRDPIENVPARLGDFLNAKVKQTPGLNMYILAWDFPMLYMCPIKGVNAAQS